MTINKTDSTYQLAHTEKFSHTFPSREGEKAPRTVVYAVQISMQNNLAGFPRFSFCIGRMGKDDKFVSHMPLYSHVNVHESDIDNAVFVDDEPAPYELFGAMLDFVREFLLDNGRAVWKLKMEERRQREEAAATKEGRKAPKDGFAKVRRSPVPMALTPANRLKLSMAAQLEPLKDKLAQQDEGEDEAPDSGYARMAAEVEARDAAERAARAQANQG